MADGLAVPRMPGNAGGGKEPWFESDTERMQGVTTGASLTGSEKVRKLQTVLHAKAKEDPERRFHTLIDEVCDSARRIIGRLGERGADGVDVIFGGADGSGGDRPPKAKMRKFAASIAKSKGIDPPAGYTKSAATCRAFLDEHAPRRIAGQGARRNSGGGTAGAA